MNIQINPNRFQSTINGTSEIAIFSSIACEPDIKLCPAGASANGICVHTRSIVIGCLGHPTVTGPGADHLSRAIGIEAETPIDLIMGRVVVGDLYLLCSDGLTKMVRQDDRIRDALLETRDLQMAVQRLIGMASIAGGLDNIAVVLVAVREQAALP